MYFSASLRYIERIPAFVLFFVLVLVGERVNGCLSNVLFTSAAAGLQTGGFDSSLLRLCAFFALFSVLFFGWVIEFNSCCCSYASISIPYANLPWYLCLAFQVTKRERMAYLFFWPLL